MENIDLIELSEMNLADEHICCAFADKKCLKGYNLKKDWLKNQFKNGYKFIKANVRGKVFIEYIDSEFSWLPVNAENYKSINCFWVSGQFAGKGYGKALMEKCIEDSRNKAGIFTISSDKKRPFMTDNKFLKKFGFEKVDFAPPFFELWALRFDANAPLPSFYESAKSGECTNKEGIVVYYSDSCPFNEYYVNEHLKKFAIDNKLALEINYLRSREEAIQTPVPWIINSVFFEGKFLSNKIKVDKEILEIINKR
jgi:hypothetical protein